MANVNDSFFDGYYKDIWRSVIPEELTRKEIAFMVPYFALGSSTKVLDLMCGHGRHSLALARHGVPVTAVDNLSEYIDELKTIAMQEHLLVDAICSGVLDYTDTRAYDLIICMGNSFNFFPPDEATQLLSNISDLLKPGGYFLMNSWSLAETAYPRFTPSNSGKMGDMDLSTENSFHFNPARIETISTIIALNGEKEVKAAVDYIYTLSEMSALFSNAGLQLKEAWSIPGRKPFTLGEPRAYLIAVKS